MVHVRINERETNPNPCINFMSVLPMNDAIEQEEARQLLRALAAQVKPIMKSHGFTVNSLEEYQRNRVFLGRNWNHGETIEIVLRGRNGSFVPTQWLLSTLCHELAHIKHMDHGPSFQALQRRLLNEVRSLQNSGYYGDGYWSSGTRLADCTQVGGEGLDGGNFPEFICGGAHAGARPTYALRRRRMPPKAGPSHHTGAQTEKRRRAGSRITAAGTFAGEGQAINSSADVGTGFKKQASSKRGREERALAAERRLQALRGQSTSTSSAPNAKAETMPESDVDSEDDVIMETDGDRHKTMLEALGSEDLDNLRFTKCTFPEGFKLPSPTSTHSSFRVSEISADAADTRANKRQKTLHDYTEAASRDGKPSAGSTAGLAKMAQNEIELRKQGSLGPDTSGNLDGSSGAQERKKHRQTWECLVCTLRNESQHLACSACRTPRGESEWTETRS